ncbi:MAG: ABC transporter ATP-binding protein [Candidatus Nanopusillus acidilobi]
MIEIKNLIVKYKAEKGFVHAIDNINLKIDDGVIFGLVGESGSGKTTLGLTFLRILPKNAIIESGEIIFSGINILNLPENEMIKYRGKKISMIFQGAMNSLNPVVNIEKQVAEPLIYHDNLSLDEALKIAREKLKMVGLPENVGKSYPHQLSGGMKQRVVIAMAIITNPEVLIADEPTTALDVVTQDRIMKLIKSLQREYNHTTILISHDLPIVSEVADRIAIMYGGKIIEVGEYYQILKNAKHPYTIGLLSSIPEPGSTKEIKGIPGEPISLVNPPPGCRLYNRCQFASDKCKTYDYSPKMVEEKHEVYCTLYGE